MKHHARRGLKAVAALLVSGMLAFSPLSQALAASATYTVNADKVNIRKSPSTDAGIVKTIRRGEEVTLVSGSLDGWLQVSYGSTIGYVSSDYVTLSAFSGSMVATVIGADKLNIRALASQKAKIVKVVPRGSVLTVDQYEDGWFHVSYNGAEGYASAEYLMLSVSTNVTEPPAPDPTPVPGPDDVSPTLLKKGDKGEAVVLLQQKLIALGYLTGTADGAYGDATVAAVKAFQSANGLKADGQAGQKTLDALNSASAPARPDATSTPTSVLKNGDKGDAVQSLQQSLITLGYLTGKADGSFGDATEAALRAFQKASGLKQDGEAGAKTLEALSRAVAELTDTTLSKGDKGDKVQTLQQNLITLGYLSGKADGEYGSKTANAVRAFQRANNLVVTDEADQATQDAIAAAVKALTNAPAATVLQKGDKGDAVQALQRQLATLGYLTGAADGMFGAATRTAVKEFQAAHSLKADGIAGRETLDAIAAAVKQATTGDDPDDPSVLKKGSRGDAVKSLQEKLISLGYLTGSADGIFGIGTISAVKAFQTVSGLPADGVVGSKTMNALNAAIDKKNNTSSEVLQKGDSGDAVKSLQTQLITLGYLSGRADGVFGESTKSAVKAFQSANGLSSDGVAGKKTQQAILDAIAKKAGDDATKDEPASTTLRRGSTGSAVKAVQSRLIELGYLPAGNADGDFGTLTENAVRAFQSNNGLSVDGVVSTKTLEKLNSSSAVKAEAPVISTGALASKIIATAKQYLGCPYVYATRGPKTFDCSGFTYYVFKQYGYSLKGSAYLQGYNEAYPKIASMSALQPGDLVFFNTIADNDLSDHTGIYIGGGDFIHASSGGGHVMISSMLKGYYYTNFSWGRRVLN